MMDNLLQKTTIMTTPQQDVMWPGPGAGAVSVLTTVYSSVPQSSYQTVRGASNHMGGYNMAPVADNNVYHHNGNMTTAGDIAAAGAKAMGGSLNPYAASVADPRGGGAEYAVPQAAAMNAVHVAAAAVATATATAVALDHSQFQQYSQNAAYGAQSYMAPVGMMPSQHTYVTTTPRMMVTHRVPMPSTNYGMQPSGHHLSRTAMPLQQQGMDKCPASSYEQQQQAQMYANGLNARFNYDAYPGQNLGGYQHNFGSNGACAPTPPMTPAFNNSAASSYINASKVDIKPAVNCQMPDDDKLTLPVANGVIMEPFRLEHNSPVTQHVFYLNEHTFNFLCASPGNDLQLKCFHQDEKVMCYNWPSNANVQISVNETPVPLVHNNKPLYIKQLCQPNRNRLQISVEQCSCSHLFELSLVQRVNIEAIRENLMRKRMLPQDQAREKMKRLFHSGGINSLRPTDDHFSDIEQMSINVSLSCPLSMQPLRYPARGQLCKHPQCFDVETFLKLNKDRNKWFCPLCKIELHLDSLEIDQFIWGILCNVKDSSVDEITIDSALMWRASCKTNFGDQSRMRVKEECATSAGVAKRFKSTVDQPWSAHASTSTTPNVNPYASGAMPLTPAGSQLSSVLSPSFSNVTASPPPVVVAPRRRHGTNEPSTPQSRAQRAAGPATPKALSDPLTPLTPVVGGSGGNPPSNEPAPQLHSQTAFGSQSQLSDGCFASASAPYTPASVGSNGSMTAGQAAPTKTHDQYGGGQELYGDLESLLCGANTNDSAGLFADSMDPLELLKYLDNGEASELGGAKLSSKVAGGKSGQDAAASETSLVELTSLDDVLSLSFLN